jgi:FdhD protein
MTTEERSRARFVSQEKPANVATVSVARYRDGTVRETNDVVAGEEPMEIRVLWEGDAGLVRRSIAVTMRTPGDDFELAAGFLFAEGVIDGLADIADIAYCSDESEDQWFNIVTVTLRPGRRLDEKRLERNFFTTSSCGICGKATLEALEVEGCEPLLPGVTVDGDVLRSLPDSLRRAQELFASTGGLHGAGLFNSGGKLLAVKEDVGRHNALDKLIGEQLLAGALPLDSSVVCLSGRASFELLQKALVARIPVVAAVGAPSSLAVALAQAFGMTLAGFTGPSGFNVYAGRERVRE